MNAAKRASPPPIRTARADSPPHGSPGYLSHLPMHPARPPTPMRRPSPALSHASRPLIVAPRAPICLSAAEHSRPTGVRAWKAVGGGCRRAGGQVGRLVRGCRGVAARPQAPVLLYLLAYASVPLVLILVQASMGWCTPFLGCLHGLVCLYQIKLKSSSNQAQIKCYIRSQKLILRHVTRATTTTHQLQKNAHKQTS